MRGGAVANQPLCGARAGGCDGRGRGRAQRASGGRGGLPGTPCHLGMLCNCELQAPLNLAQEGKEERTGFSVSLARNLDPKHLGTSLGARCALAVWMPLGVELPVEKGRKLAEKSLAKSTCLESIAVVYLFRSVGMTPKFRVFTPDCSPGSFLDVFERGAEKNFSTAGDPIRLAACKANLNFIYP